MARFNAVYAEYRNAPDVTRRRLYLEAMETLFGETGQGTLVDMKLDNFLPIRNLDKEAAQ